MPPMELSRTKAVKILEIEAGKGTDLRILAGKYQVTVFTESGMFNKGWAGQVCEHILGQKPNSFNEPDFVDPITGPWELKAIPLVKVKGILVPKETMAVTMINPSALATTDFFDSRLWHKLKSLVIVGRLRVDDQETTSPLLSAAAFDMNLEMIEQLKLDYEEAQQTLLKAGFSSLNSSIGKYLQPRTKGPGHGSTSRAFYLKKPALKKILEV